MSRCIKLQILAALLVALGACSGSNPPVRGAAVEGAEEEEEDEGARQQTKDAGRDTQPRSGKDGPGSDPERGDTSDFGTCAEARFDAERGPRGGNVVWVIDTSGSMDEEAALVQQHINEFAASIVATGLADYRVVMVSERDFVRVPDPLGSDREHFLHIEEEVSSSEPLEDLLARAPDYQGFLLTGVVTHFVVVTDDESDLSAQSFVTQMTARIGGDFRVHAIASPPGDKSGAAPSDPLSDLFDDDDDDDSGCRGSYGAASEEGVQHWEAARLTMGLTFSICADDWRALFGELAKEVGESAKVPCNLALPDLPPGESLAPELINVVYTAPAQDPENLPRVEGASRCGAERAWYYDDPKAPTRVLLCPASCSAAEQGGALEVVLGCETFVQ